MTGRTPVPWRAWLGALLAAVALALLLHLPVLGRAGVFLGAPEVDLPAHLWTLWWATRPDGAALANHPTGGVDFYVLEPVNLAVFALVEPVLGLAPAHHAGTLLAVVVAGLGGFGLGRTVGEGPGREAAGFAGLLLLATSPPLLEALRDGTGEFTWVGLLALALAALWRLDARAGRRELLLAALALAACALACWYYGLMAGLAGLLLGLCRGRRALLATALAGGVALLLVSPLALAFHGSDLERPWPVGGDLLAHLWAGGGGAEPDAWLREEPLHQRLAVVGQGGQARLFWAAGLLGAAVLALRSAPGRRRLWPWALVALLGLLLALGSRTAGGLPLPLLPLNRLLTWFARPLHLPFHFSTLAVLGLLVLATAGLAASRRPRRGLLLLGGLVFLDLLVPPSSPLPLPSLRLPEGAALDHLAARPGGAVLDWPSIARREQAALDGEALRQLVHGHPIPRFPVRPTDALRDEGVAAARASRLASALQQAEPPEAVDTGDLVDLGYGWVLLDQEAAPADAASLSAWLGAPVAQDGRHALFALPGAGATPPSPGP